MKIDIIMQILKNKCRCGKRHLFNVIKDSFIENELNTDLTWIDIYNKYNDSNITSYNLHLQLIIAAQNKKL